MTNKLALTAFSQRRVLGVDSHTRTAASQANHQQAAGKTPLLHGTLRSKQIQQQ